MHKLVILISVPEGDETFENGWPEFLALAEKMPGLRKEATSRVSYMIYGEKPISMIHELYFDSLPILEAAMQAETGARAGAMLQRITGGRFSLLFADHHEDLIENFQRPWQDPE